MARLSDDEITTGLSRLDGWTRAGNEIAREFRFPSFAAAVTFVNRVADLAEEADHHPDIDIRYDRVRLALSTHSAGGLTARDLRLAARIDAIPAESPGS
jgi:4a-hydroxytetrahydrobiopterin dehydratase